MKKAELAKLLTEIKLGNWYLTGFKGKEDEARKALFRIHMGMTIKELNNYIDNITVLS